MDFAVYNPENFAFLILRNIELFTPEDSIFFHKVCYFLIYSIVPVCLQTNISYISGARNSKSKCFYNAKLSAYYFHVKTKIPLEF